jgi:gluconolactonase
MKKWILLFFIPSIIYSCTKPENYGEFQVADDEFFSYVSKNAIVEKIGTEYQFTEGPVWSDEGFLLFSDIPANRIYQWMPEGDVTVFIEPSNNSNGLTFDGDGLLVACEHGGRAIVRYEPDGQRFVVADNYMGKKFNSPNDLVIHSSGAIFFTDPPWGLPELDDDPAKEIPFNGVFVIIDGEVKLIDSTLFRPNGIALSPDEKYLYVGNSQYSGGTDQMSDVVNSWFRYTLTEDHTAMERIEFCDAPDSSVPGNPDGMKVDMKGNLYCTGPGGLLIFNSEGKYLGSIVLPELPTNCAFGGKDGKTLFITDRKQIFKVDLLVEGVKP